MDFLQLVLSRQSDRAYDKGRPVEAEKLERILEAARLSPSACNAQPWKFVVVTDHERALKVGKALKKVGAMARKDIERFFDKKVFLEMFVKVEKDWRNRDNMLKNFGYQLD